jgi:hypothetical protein
MSGRRSPDGVAKIKNPAAARRPRGFLWSGVEAYLPTIFLTRATMLLALGIWFISISRE